MRAMTTPRRHPHFDDRHSVDWFPDVASAVEEAQRSGRRILVVHGGEKCGGTRALVERNLVKQEIADYLNQHFVAVASDPARPDSAVSALLPLLPKHEPTPVLIYLDSELRVVHSTVGGRPAAVLLNEMLE